MKVLPSLTFLCAFGLINFSVAVLNTTLPESMFRIGIADGKILYGDMTTMYWNQAKAYCASVGMSMVDVNTEDKLALLERTHLDGYLRIWTSGRDSKALRMISWDNTNEMPDIENIGVYYGEYQVCLVGESHINHFTFALDLCTARHQILCEMDAE